MEMEYLEVEMRDRKSGASQREEGGGDRKGKEEGMKRMKMRRVSIQNKKRRMGGAVCKRGGISGVQEVREKNKR